MINWKMQRRQVDGAAISGRSSDASLHSELPTRADVGEFEELLAVTENKYDINRTDGTIQSVALLSPPTPTTSNLESIVAKLVERAAADADSIRHLREHALKATATISGLKRKSELFDRDILTGKFPWIFSSWSEEPDSLSFNLISQQLRAKTGTSKVHHIAWEPQTLDFAKPEAIFAIESPEQEVVSGVFCKLLVKRRVSNGPIGCYVFLSGYRGDAAFTISGFRFGRGQPEQWTGTDTWNEDRHWGWDDYFSQEELEMANGFLTVDNKLRFLLSVQLD